MNFNPTLVKAFRFVSWAFDEASGVASFNYAFDGGPSFTERYVFHGAKLPLDPGRLNALRICLRYLHLMAGISYYKAAIPSQIKIDCGTFSEETAFFFEELYLKGLGEFAYRNGVDLHERIHFPFAKAGQPLPSDITLDRRTAVPVGGGKDSVVTVEILKSFAEPMVLFSLGNFKVIEDVVKIANKPHINVSRSVSSNLLALNSEGALNGHIPISAIIAFVLPAAAILYGFDSAALSNERSANVGNVVLDGAEINHQYSKSYEFERRVAGFIKNNVLTNFQYYSFLRPFSDLGIARLFSKCASYHSVFTSCNAAFRIRPEERVGRWCLDCPKCRFTFLALAPFMGKTELLSIFGKNLLDDNSQLPGFQELLGVRGHKPFECVGEVGESIAAFSLLVHRPEWRNDSLVRYFADMILPTIKDPDALIKTSLGFSDTHMVSPYYEEILRAYSGS